MDEYVIRTLAADRLEGAVGLSTTAGWNQRVDDWRMLLASAPGGCFAAWHGSHVVGTAIGIDYGGFGWIAMMLVDPAHRSRGLGRRLLEAAVGAIPASRPVRLDATPLGRPLYQSYGFEDEAMLTRLVAPAGRPATEAPPVGQVRPLRPDDLTRIAPEDAAVFGGDRRAVLAWAREAAPKLGWIVDDASQPPQYCVGRAGRLFTQIGPVVAVSDAAARLLAGAARRAVVDQPITIDAFDGAQEFREWLRTEGFEVQRPLYRMHRPSADGSTRWAPPAGLTLADRAILGPEFA